MSDVNYRLPCACGQTVRVDATQAGQDVVCGCGATLTVPRLRDLQNLEREAAPPSERPVPPPAAPRSSLSGCLFAVAFLTFIGCTVFSIAMIVQRSRLHTHRPLESILAESEEQVDKLTLDESYQLWKAYLQQGVWGEMPTHEIVDWTRARMYIRLATWGGGGAVLALATMIGVGVATRRRK